MLLIVFHQQDRQPGCTAIVIMDYCTGQAISHCVYVMRRVHRCVFSICVAQKFNAQDKQLARSSRVLQSGMESMEIKPMPMVATAVAARLSCSNVNCNALCSRLRLPFACLQLLQLSADTCMQNTHSSIRLTAGTRPGTARGQQHFFALWFLHCAENLLHGTLSRQVVI